MSDPKLVTIRRCGPVWEAEMLRDRLEAAGIRAFLQGTETNRSLSYVGVALGGVKVQVATDDVAAAEQVLLEDEHQRLTAGSWQCPRCDEMNDPAFDICWNCSMPRGEAVESQDESPARHGEQGHPPGEAALGNELFVDPRDRPRETTNPYQSLDPYRPSASRQPSDAAARFDDFEPRSGLGIVRLLTLLILAAVILYIIITLAEGFAPN